MDQQLPRKIERGDTHRKAYGKNLYRDGDLGKMYSYRIGSELEFSLKLWGRLKIVLAAHKDVACLQNRFEFTVQGQRQ